MPAGGTALGTATDARVVGTLNGNDLLYARSNGSSPYTEYLVFAMEEYDDNLEDNAVTLRLWKRVNTTVTANNPGTGVTLLGTYATGVQVQVATTLECVGTAIKVIVGGVARITVTDADIAGGGSWGHVSATSVSFTSLDAACDVSFSVGSGGGVSPASLSDVDSSVGKTFTVTPDAGYVIASVTGSTGLTITPSTVGQKSATAFTVKATQDGTVALAFASLTPSVGTATCDMHGGMSIPVTEGHSSTTGFKAFWCDTSGGTYTQITAGNLAVTEGTGGAWTVLIRRPDLYVDWGSTLYVKLKATHAEGDSAFSSVASVVLAQDTDDVLAAHATAVVTRALGQVGYIEHSETIGSYSSTPLLPRTMAYYLDPTAQNLSLVEAQFDHLKTFEDANGIVTQTGSAYVLADSHYRAVWHSYIAAKLLEAKGETTLSAEIRTLVDEWAVNYLTYAKLIAKTYNSVTFTTFAVNTTGTWIGADAGNQDLWGCMVLAHLYNDPASALYHSTAAYESRSGGTFTIPEIITQTLTGVAACQWSTTNQAGYIPWGYPTPPIEGEDIYTGYHLAAHVSLLGIQAAFGDGWSTTLDDMLDASYTYMTTGAKWTDESNADFEWNEERGVAFYAATAVADPVPGLNYSWSRHKTLGKGGDYGAYVAPTDYDDVAVSNNDESAYITGFYRSIDGLLSAYSYMIAIWFTAPGSFTATLDGATVDLAWQTTYCDGYEIERKVDSGEYAALATVSGGTTATYADISLPEEWSTLTYRIRAYNGGGASAWTESDPVSAPATGTRRRFAILDPFTPTRL